MAYNLLEIFENANKPFIHLRCMQPVKIVLRLIKRIILLIIQVLNLFSTNTSKTVMIFAFFAIIISLLPFQVYIPVLSATQDYNNEGIVDVVTSVAPIANIIKNIGGDRISIVNLIPEGVDSHTFDLSPLDAIAVSEADLIIINGLFLESAIEKIIQANDNPQFELLKLADSAITQDKWIFDNSFPRELGQPNPHLWLDVQHAINYSKLIRDKLVQIDPANSDYYNQNAINYISLLENLDGKIAEAINSIPEENKKLVTYHDSWAYFGPRYGLQIISTIQPSDFGEPTAQDVAKLIDQLRILDIPAIFGSEVFPSKIVDQIAHEADVNVVENLSDDDLPGELGDKTNTYVGMMLDNVKTIVSSLGGNSSVLHSINSSDIFNLTEQNKDGIFG